MTVQELINTLSKYHKDTLVLQIPPHRVGYVKVNGAELIDKVKTTNGGANYYQDNEDELVIGPNAVILY